MKDKKVILLSSIIVVSVLLLGLTVFLLVSDKKSDESKYAYGVVVEKGSNYVLVDGVDNKSYYVASTDDISVGTFVSIYYPKKSDIEKGNGSISVVLDENETSIVPDLTTTKEAKLDHDEYATRTTTSTIIKTLATTTTTYKYTKTQEKEKNEDVVFYAENAYNTLSSETFSLDKAKEYFITLVDFIFYNGEIKGKRFDELTSSAKAKVVYYTLMLDAKIDSKWPDYKNNIGTKYADIKAKLLAKYMDLTTSICESNNETCAMAKEDFKLMRESVNLTWNTLKNAFSYAYNKGKDAIVNWYEIFSGKR